MNSEKRGNLANVRDKLRVGMVVDYVDPSTADRRMAQIVPSGSPVWFVVEIANRDVEVELVKRRFGIYVPEIRETVVSRGRRVGRRRSMFPGYVFVFIWTGGGNLGRLFGCDGVLDVVGTLNGEEVDLIRAVENAQGFPIVKKPRRNSRVRHHRWEAWLKEIRSLDSDRRNQALQKLLSLF